MPRWPPDAQWFAEEDANRVVSGEYSMRPGHLPPADSQQLRRARLAGERIHTADELMLPSAIFDTLYMHDTQGGEHEERLDAYRMRLQRMEEDADPDGVYGRPDPFPNDLNEIPVRRGHETDNTGARQPTPPSQFTMAEARQLIDSNVAAELRDQVARGIAQQLHGDQTRISAAGWRRRQRDLVEDVGSAREPNYDANMRATHSILGQLPTHSQHEG